MGLSNEGGRIYVGISKDGRLYRKEGDQVTYYRTIKGRLFKISVKHDGKYGPELHITLFDGDYYTVQMFLNSGYASAFMKTIKNAALAESITLIPTCREKEGRKQYGMILQQNGVALKAYFTNDNPNGMPAPGRKFVEKGDDIVEVPDYDAQLHFLMNVMDTEINAFLPPSHIIEAQYQGVKFTNSPPANTDSSTQQAYAQDNSGVDDLPF